VQKITPFIWFDDKAEEAVKLYTSLIANSSIGKIEKYNAQAAKASGQSEGSVMTVSFTLAGQDFTAINGGKADFVGNGAGRVSFVVSCQDQAEIDKLWDTLTEGGMELPCGWLTDKYGVTWQIVPQNLNQLLSKGAWPALLKMKKINIADLQKAQ